ncbi:N,N-dimethylformamidase beta subunit family domain-containing protein [Kitasatospora sp. NPDC059646]|uniref:N,N-dimethylformamidase beta subunit family domain-containing protein n=1 Tax=Kitasatospora sp. NPDC059646 TaxID=3346893 RepID=UPI00369E1555
MPGTAALLNAASPLSSWRLLRHARCSPNWLTSAANAVLTRSAPRSNQVSFDRPYQYDDGAGLFLVYEAPLIALAEKLGIPLSYTTCIDVAADPNLLHGAKAVLSLGHDEYWSPEQRAHIRPATPAGQIPANGLRAQIHAACGTRSRQLGTGTDTAAR